VSERVYPRGLAPGQHCPCNGTGVIEHSDEKLEVCSHAVYFTDGPLSESMELCLKHTTRFEAGR
jgi:hypothetical protein